MREAKAYAVSSAANAAQARKSEQERAKTRKARKEKPDMFWNYKCSEFLVVHEKFSDGNVYPEQDASSYSAWFETYQLFHEHPQVHHLCTWQGRSRRRVTQICLRLTWIPRSLSARGCQPSKA